MDARRLGNRIRDEGAAALGRALERNAMLRKDWAASLASWRVVVQQVVQAKEDALVRGGEAVVRAGALGPVPASVLHASALFVGVAEAGTAYGTRDT
mgnify:CR=1 FL=1